VIEISKLSRQNPVIHLPDAFHMLTTAHGNRGGRHSTTRQHCILQQRSGKKTLPQEGEASHEIEKEGRFNMNHAQPLLRVSLSNNLSYLKINGLNL
jgi:hypothetical protein